MTTVLTRPTALVREVRTGGVEARALQVLAFLTVALSSFEGYLLEINTTVTKVPAGLLILAWFAARVRQRRLPAFHPVHLALAVLAVAVLASAAIHNGDTFTMDYAQRWVSFLLTALVLLDLASREVPVRVLVWASVLGAAVAGGGALWSFLIDDSPRATGPLEDPNDLAYVLVSAVPLLVALFVPRRRRDRPDGAPRRTIPRPGAALIGVLVLILVLGAAVTVSRGGLIALGVALAWLGLRRGIAPRVLVAVGAVVAVGGVVLALAFSSLVGQALSQKDQVAGSNVDTRALRWQVAAQMLPEHPLLGVGPGGFRSNYLGVSHNAELAEQTPVAHNMYVEVAAELGLLGLAGFLGVIVVALWSSERAIRSARAGPDRLLPLAVQCSLVAILVASAFLSEQYYMPLWSMIAAACALGLRNGTEPVR
ncbi:O-antigen ligase [Pseudonocardia sp. KRD291]|uniref:O-antigen ligase family protein n=1 Tax=Pseudonocardia sp. KRD291 TaxID=2792007 RepID=UPI001C4A61A9|nr:O-antigen ligase family protein [Pseudonocardia sp. KRD291]MBW0103468.1 O-antigen ligase family protein [Pseudonocardia sp. KRD291]